MHHHVTILSDQADQTCQNKTSHEPYDFKNRSLAKSFEVPQDDKNYHAGVLKT